MRAASRIARLRELLAAEKLDAIVVRSVTDLQWLTGFEGVFDTEEAHTALVTASTCLLHSDSRYSTALRDAAAEEGLWEIDDGREDAAGYVKHELERLGLQAARVAIDADMPLSLYRKLAECLPEAELVERTQDIFKLRAVKDDTELAVLREAQAIASAAFEELLVWVRPGMSEREVSLKLEFAMRERGADELAFPNIVASGPNSANPHAIPGERTLQPGDFVVIDFGARIRGYRSDTTRTICIGASSAEHKRIYDAVRLANETVEAAIKPGVTGKAMHELAEQVMADAGYPQLMGHGLGHGVGLDIHELPLNSLRYDKPLVEGSVVTVEPGIYIPREVGVRLEDCGTVTGNGYESFCALTHDLICV